MAVAVGCLYAEEGRPVSGHGAAGLSGVLEVDPDSGAASVYLPLGPGIGSREVRYVPALVGRFAPQVGMASPKAGNGTLGFGPTLLSTSGFELSPGVLDLPLVSADSLEGPQSYPGLRWTYPDGSGGAIGPALPPDLDAKTVLARFGYGPSVLVAGMPHPAGTVPVASLLPGAGGDFLLSLADEVRFPVREVNCLDGNNRQIRLAVPSRVLAARGDVAYEFELSAAWKEEPLVLPASAHYRLIAIRSGSGAIVTFDYDQDGVGFVATCGLDTLRVALERMQGADPVPALNAPVSIRDGAPGAAYLDVGVCLRVTYGGGHPLDGYSVVAVGRPECLPDAFRRNLQVTLVQGDADGAPIRFEYGKAPDAVCFTEGDPVTFAPTVLQEIRFPGQRARLEWRYQVDAGDGCHSPGAQRHPQKWSFGVGAVQALETDPEGRDLAGPPRVPIRQRRHFALSGAPCQTFARDRWGMGDGGSASDGARDGNPHEAWLGYHDGRDIPTFCLDPDTSCLLPVTGQLTRWINGTDGADLHEWPGGTRMGLLGGGNGGSKSGGGAGRGADRGPTSVNSLSAIRAYDHSHSKPGHVSGNGYGRGGQSFGQMRELNSRHRQEALDRATNNYLKAVGGATAAGAVSGAVTGIPGGLAGAVGNGIVGGVGRMAPSAVLDGVKLTKEREHIEQVYRENLEMIDNAERESHTHHHKPGDE